MNPRTLGPCPASPNCVSTQASDEGHAIVPFRYRKSRAEAKEALKEIIRSLPRTKLVEEDESYLHYEFTSLLIRFVDDLSFSSTTKPRPSISVPPPAPAMAIWASIASAWSRCGPLLSQRCSFIWQFPFELCGLLL